MGKKGKGGRRRKEEGGRGRKRKREEEEEGGRGRKREEEGGRQREVGSHQLTPAHNPLAMCSTPFITNYIIWKEEEGGGGREEREEECSTPGTPYYQLYMHVIW